MVPRPDRNTIEIADHTDVRKVASGFHQDLLRLLKARNVGNQQFTDIGLAREPGGVTRGQVSTRPGERRVALEKRRLDNPGRVRASSYCL